MDYTYYEQKGRDLRLRGVQNLSMAEIVHSGQCFRWRQLDGEHFRGIVYGRVLEVEQRGDELVLRDVDERAFVERWRDYFDLGRDYGELKAMFAQDRHLRAAMAFCPGMRVLRQEPWETLCSFILSQNNNIARITGLVARLSEQLGEALGGAGDFAFPTPGALAGAAPEQLEPVRCGFRTKYLLDAARLVAGGELELEPLFTLPVPEAMEQLQRIHGVGPKVAQCVLLYGFARVEALPVDVWIARALEEFYPRGFPKRLTPWAGIAQQYLFHYIRNRDKQLSTV